jgi:hypothetical protein
MSVTLGGIIPLPSLEGAILALMLLGLTAVWWRGCMGPSWELGAPGAWWRRRLGGHRPKSASLLLRLLEDDDLATLLLGACAPTSIVRVGRTCRAACKRVEGQAWQVARASFMHVRSMELGGSKIFLLDTRGQSWGEEPAALDASVAANFLLPPEPFAPHARDEWSFERLHLCLSPPTSPPISFGFATSALTTIARRQLAALADRLRPHPGLRVRVNGYARRALAPSTAQGLACAQARAVRVRQYLLQQLQRDDPASPWLDEDAGEGVRPGGYSEDTDEDLFQSLAHYTPGGVATPVGTRVIAHCCWPQDASGWSSYTWRMALLSPRADNSFMAEVVVTGFDPASALAF